MVVDAADIQAQEPQPGRNTAAQPPAWVLALVALLLVGGWHHHLVWLWRKGWHNEYYGHGFLIPLITAYLIYRRRGEMAAAPRERFWLGLPVVAAGLLSRRWRTLHRDHRAGGQAHGL